ncbi:hypothetical protein BDK51DRAFT_44655 [Blyttiomyces helicus]|uniref:Uncharacterized protein n=1 Tax=Blyttiomyces helicus TaxID=388810 RepID=A0A4P9WQG5_9FUNG|nr:hypothetical protein BDK51DRAFT_44655 [Blyttiomyces helicus]|eukprot:RKO93116.1 hypothetical protein BDK51DRAFT_44655 [Blyttiomyces helicus]
MPFIYMENNLGRNIGLTDGTEVFAERIICDAPEPLLPTAAGVDHTLKYLPQALVMHAPSLEIMDENLKRRRLKLQGLEKSMILLIPWSTTFRVKTKSPIESNNTITIRRTGYQIIPALPMTSHKSQGKSMQEAILDLSIPRGPFDTNCTYIELERTHKPDGIAILRNMDPEMLDLLTAKEVDIPSVRSSRLDVGVSRV